jgi:hypothetical protein
MLNPYVVITYILVVLASISLGINASFCIWVYTDPDILQKLPGPV